MGFASRRGRAGRGGSGALPSACDLAPCNLASLEFGAVPPRNQPFRYDYGCGHDDDDYG